MKKILKWLATVPVALLLGYIITFATKIPIELTALIMYIAVLAAYKDRNLTENEKEIIELNQQVAVDTEIKKIGKNPIRYIIILVTIVFALIIFSVTKDEFMNVIKENFMPDFQAMQDKWFPDKEFNDSLDSLFGNHSPETQKMAREGLKKLEQLRGY